MGRKEKWKVMSDGGLGVGWKCIGVYDNYINASIALDNLISTVKDNNVQYKITKEDKDERKSNKQRV